MKILNFLLPVVLAAALSLPSRGAIRTKVLEYKDGDVTLEGYLAYDEAAKEKRPAVLIVHDWMGLGSYVKKRAEAIAGLGYVAFGADIYGQGVRPSTGEEAARQAGIYRQDRALMRRRIQAALAEVRNLPFVDGTRVAAMGYCFGGGVVLELARSGADIRGAVTFHGSLDTPHPVNAGIIKAKILVLHGADDPFVGQDQVLAFEKEMKAARVDWELNLYSNAVHSFTNPDAGNDPSKGSAYNREADLRSWEAMKAFFEEIFRP